MKLQSIQVLRGFAALSVAMNHLVSFERESIRQNGFEEASLAGGLWENGFAGVDLFFVISGFIMVYVTAGRERSPISVGDFYAARAARIYPLWWLFMIAMAAVFLLSHGTPYHPEEFAKTDAGVIAYLLKSTLLIPQEGLPILGVGWTLIHEMYFYLVFGLFLLLPQRLLPALLAGWGALVIASYPAGLTSPDPDTLLHLATYPMTIEFVLGAMAGLLYLRVRVPASGAALASSAGAISFLVALVWFQNSAAPEAGIWATLHWGRVICFGLPSVILVYGLANLERSELVTFPKWAVWLGDISFALYLSHTIVFTAVKRGFVALGQAGADSFLVGVSGLVDNILFGVASLGAAIVIAAISYRFFERPSLKWLSRLRLRLIRPIRRAELARG